MVQDSLVDYINGQMKAGVSRDAIKSTLTGAGWTAVDVEDTLKKIEGGKAATGPAPVTMGSSSGPEPKTIKVSDLVSGSPSLASSPSSPVSPASTASPMAKPGTAKSPLTGMAAPMTAAGPAATPAGMKTAAAFQAASYPDMKARGSRGALITEIVLGVLVVIFGAIAGFLYMQNGTLTSQLSSLNGQSSGVNSQLAQLQGQVAASTTALTAQVSALSGQNNELRTELSFLAAPSGTVPGATATATVTGIAEAGKAGYMIVTNDGVKIAVANSKSLPVSAALMALISGGKPVATSTAMNASTSTASSTASSTPTATSTAPAASAGPVTAAFTGTYVPGSDMITLTAINGSPLQ